MPLFMPAGRQRGGLDQSVVSASSGREMTGQTVADAQASTGLRLDGVQVHDDAYAHAAAMKIRAHAFTLNEHIYLGPTLGTSQGPNREEALRHELVHVAQVRHGRRTGRHSPEPLLEQEAQGVAESGAVETVQQGADASVSYGFWWLLPAAAAAGASALYDEEDEPSSSNSSSDSSSEEWDSSHLGMQRSVWAHAREGVVGGWEIGPIDAWDAAFGEDTEGASELGGEFDDRWTRNAVRQGVWQARLAHKHGSESAEVVGYAHEWGSPDALDSWIDQYNNGVAREIGAEAASEDEIPELIRQAIKEGSLITSPDDWRVPEELREGAL